MTMQPLTGTNTILTGRYDRWGNLVSSTMYSLADAKAALHTHRTEVFRYELWRVSGGVLTGIGDITNAVKSCVIHYDGHGEHYMVSADIEIKEEASAYSINFLTDVIRVYHLLKMPDGNYIQWLKGTFYIPSPKKTLTYEATRAVTTQDSLRVIFDTKITDWLKIPSPIPPTSPYTGSDDGDPVNWARHLVYIATGGIAGIDISPNTSLRVQDDPPPAPTRNRSKIYEVGTSYLDVINSLMLFCNYDILWVDPIGTFTAHPFVNPSARPVDYTYTADTSSIIIAGSGTVEQDLWDAPNQWLRVVTRPDAPLLRSRRTLDDPANPLSTAYRGRTVTDYQQIDAPDQATLDTVVDKLYEDGQRVLKTLKVAVPLMPHVHHDKVIMQWATNHPWYGEANGVYTIYGWDFPCVPGGKMELSLELVAFSQAVPPAAASTEGQGSFSGFGVDYRAGVVSLGTGSEGKSVIAAVPNADSGAGSEAKVVSGVPAGADSGAGTESAVKTP